MVSRLRVATGATALAVLCATLATVAGAAARTGRIVGYVRECNTPTTCIVQPFTLDL